MRGSNDCNVVFITSGVSRSLSTETKYNFSLSASGPRLSSMLLQSSSVVGQTSGQCVNPNTTPIGWPSRSDAVSVLPCWVVSRRATSAARSHPVRRWPRNRRDGLCLGHGGACRGEEDEQIFGVDLGKAEVRHAQSGTRGGEFQGQRVALRAHALRIGDELLQPLRIAPIGHAMQIGPHAIAATNGVAGPQALLKRPCPGVPEITALMPAPSEAPRVWLSSRSDGSIWRSENSNRNRSPNTDSRAHSRCGRCRTGLRCDAR